ncbi:MAG TPA: HAD-IB family hydrolase [Candidatus Thermoplasmatota archaeon]|nr:HAD-IB family hydrolase [Candidatus Thermoplasmatota archaeon]
METPPARGAAFFDFDRTLLHGDAGVIFGMTLADWGYAQGRDLRGREFLRHHARTSATLAGKLATGITYKALGAVGLLKRSRLVELSYRFLAGLPAGEMSARMKQVWNERLRERIYPDMARILDDHRKAGRRIVIVTTGLRELVEHARETLGGDVEVIGAEMLSTDGVWQGRVQGPLYGVHKAVAVRAWAERNGIDLAESWAYSDHWSDLAFLSVVGHPVAVNPQLRLALHARKKGWSVVYVLPPSRPEAKK